MPSSPRLTGRLDEEIVQFLGAFAIAPVADPDEILLRPRGKQRAKHGRVGGLMPGEDPPAPAQTFIATPQGLAECQHGVVILTAATARWHSGFGHAAMMGVVKQQGEAASGLAQAADARDQVRRGPFVHDHHVGAIQRCFVVEAPARRW